MLAQSQAAPARQEHNNKDQQPLNPATDISRRASTLIKPHSVVSVHYNRHLVAASTLPKESGLPRWAALAIAQSPAQRLWLLANKAKKQSVGQDDNRVWVLRLHTRIPILTRCCDYN